MHRNSFLDAPRYLRPDLRLRGFDRTWFAGQITGAEGYVEAAACGLLAALSANAVLRGRDPVIAPPDTALGAVLAHLQNVASIDFQPSNVSWAFFSPLPNGPRDKRERRRLMSERALANLGEWLVALEHNDAANLVPA
jgi:methylenetetrahydrofolate--tRNA-(uracil-5-)-methyltransferase